MRDAICHGECEWAVDCQRAETAAKDKDAVSSSTDCKVTPASAAFAIQRASHLQTDGLRMATRFRGGAVVDRVKKDWVTMARTMKATERENALARTYIQRRSYLAGVMGTHRHAVSIRIPR